MITLISEDQKNFKVTSLTLKCVNNAIFESPILGCEPIAPIQLYIDLSDKETTFGPNNPPAKFLNISNLIMTIHTSKYQLIGGVDINILFDNTTIGQLDTIVEVKKMRNLYTLQPLMGGSGNLIPHKQELVPKDHLYKVFHGYLLALKLSEIEIQNITPSDEQTSSVNNQNSYIASIDAICKLIDRKEQVPSSSLLFFFITILNTLFDITRSIAVSEYSNELINKLEKNGKLTREDFINHNEVITDDPLRIQKLKDLHSSIRLSLVDYILNINK